MEELSKEELLELEKQLSHPNGEMGVEVGNRMNESNINMTLKTIAALKLQSGMNVLELGHGNCGHLPRLLSHATPLTYHGLEISETMYKQALQLNAQQVSDGHAKFSLYDGLNIPDTFHGMDRVFTVNTLYFWSQPSHLLSEVEKVLKPGGQFLITFAKKSFMTKLPFIGERFKLYENEDVESLVNTGNFRLDGIEDIVETVTSKDGKSVERHYSIAKLTKP